MYKVEVWKSDPARQKGMFYLYMTFDTKDGLSKDNCMECAKDIVADLKIVGGISIQIQVRDSVKVYGYDHLTGKEFK